MKKVTLLIALAALVMLAGCKKENDTKGVTLKASIEQNKGNGRTSLNPADGAISWTAGDKILVNNGSSNAIFTLTGGAGTTEGTFTYNGEYEFGTDNVAVYPEIATINGNTVSFTLPEEQAFTAAGTFGNGANPMLGIFSDSEDLTFTSLCGGLGISLTGDNVDITGIEIVSNNTNDKLNGAFECTMEEPALVATLDNAGTNRVMLNCATTLTADTQGFFIVLPVGALAEGFTLNVYNGGEEPIFSTYTDNDISIVLNQVNMMPEVTVALVPEHEYVDLGLPSGLLWATCNVGAEAPEEYGDYFAWGETQPKGEYNWSTYQYSNGGFYDEWGEELYSHLTKYCTDANYGYNGFTDDLTTLLPEDDAATANWGSDWRMPSEEEWQELYCNTTVTWTTQNGVNGRLFTASNGNSLFLPAAGYRLGSSFTNAGSWGYYWSSSLTDFPDYAVGFSFGSNEYGMSNYNRYYGRSVRAVRVGSQN